MTTENQIAANVSMEESHRLPYVRMLQNVLLVWLDENINEVNGSDSRNAIVELRQVVDSVNTFIDIDKCVDFMTDINDEKLVLIVSGSFNKVIVPLVQEIPAVTSVYIYCDNEVQYQEWAKHWNKVKGVFSDIKGICQSLRQFIRKWDQDSVSIGFFNPYDDISTKKLDQLDQSFMYSQILKEIILTLDFESTHFNEFVTYCREKCAGDRNQLLIVDKFEREYHDHTPIWWYTSPLFLYSTLNNALRTMEVDLIVKLGFFLRDLHQNIFTLHSEHRTMYGMSNSITVYRGQGLSRNDFDQLKKGGFMSFNCFLSTSDDQAVASIFAESNAGDPNQVGILFKITVDPSISSVSFANIGNLSAFGEENEILFTMHSVFRIGAVKQIPENTQVWEVELNLTDDTDPQLHVLTEKMREETQGRTGWYRLGGLMQKIGQFEKARELYETLLQQTSIEGEKAIIFHHLGYVKTEQRSYEQALQFYEKSLEINRKILPSNDLDFATTYNNIGMVYNSMSEYSKALSYYQKALEIRSKTLPPCHPDLASLYHNIGMVHDRMGDYSKASFHYEKALEIEEKTLPLNHPSIAISYSNIGLVYQHRGEYSKALLYHQKALEIQKQTLPPNHPEFGNPYGNIALAYHLMGDYSKALLYYEQALKIQQKSLPADHPHLGATCTNIAAIYSHMDEFPKALMYYEQAFEIQQKNCSSDHSSLVNYHEIIGKLYFRMGNYSKVIFHFQKKLEIEQKTLPSNQIDLAASYNVIAVVYDLMGEYSEALSFWECALIIGQSVLPANDPFLRGLRKNIELLRKKL